MWRGSSPQESRFQPLCLVKKKSSRRFVASARRERYIFSLAAARGKGHQRHASYSNFQRVDLP
jgi:hypothetical protein